MDRSIRTQIETALTIANRGELAKAALRDVLQSIPKTPEADGYVSSYALAKITGLSERHVGRIRDEAPVTIATYVRQDEGLLEMLSQSMEATGDTYPSVLGVEVPYILAEHTPDGFSGHAQYVVSSETHCALTQALSESEAAEKAHA